MRGDRRSQIYGVDGVDSLKGRSPFPGTYDQSGSHLRADAAGKIGAGRIIHGNGNHAAEGASQKRRDPLGAVRTPQKHCIALANLSRFELTGKLICHSGHATVAPAFVTVAARKHVGAVVILLLTPALEIVQ